MPKRVYNFFEVYDIVKFASLLPEGFVLLDKSVGNYSYKIKPSRISLCREGYNENLLQHEVREKPQYSGLRLGVLERSDAPVSNALDLSRKIPYAEAHWVI
jgi:hypothetical protein